MQPNDQTAKERAQMLAWVQNWRELTPILEELRRKEIREVTTVTSIAAFDSSFRKAIRDCPPEPTSGLIEQQEIFRRARR
jgi:hypothetical protein